MTLYIKYAMHGQLHMSFLYLAGISKVNVLCRLCVIYVGEDNDSNV